MADVYKQAGNKNTPKGGFIDRFSRDGDLIETGSANTWRSVASRRPPYYELKDGKWQVAEADDFPVFLANQQSLEDFYKSIKASDMYKGMFEAIGRAAIYGSRFAPVDFMRFMQPPLEYGRAVLDAAFTDINSHPWVKNDTNANVRPTLFNTDVPEMKSSVSRLEFSREISTKLTRNEYAQFCQTGAMVGEVAGVLAGKLNAAYMLDMYEACKEYFTGILRIAPEPKGEHGAAFEEKDFTSSKMISEVEVTEEKNPILRDKIIGEALQAEIHKTINRDFWFNSTAYNPVGLNTRTTQCTIIMDKSYMYPSFQKFYADTYHPDYVKTGPNVSLLWIDEFPELASNIYLSKDATATRKLIGMIVDDEALKITPVGQGLTIDSFFNPSETSISMFGHYEYIFSFLPFFNRKYIFLKINPPS